MTGSLTKDVEASDYAASSQESTGEHAPVGNAFDKNANTFWHSKYSNPSANLPHWLAFKASPGEGNKIAAITHLYRQDKLNGPAKNVAVYVVAASDANSVADVTNWGEPVATAEFPYTKELQTIALPNTIPSGDVYVKFQINDAWGLTETSAGVTWAAVAELAATAKATPVELTEPEQPKDNPEVTETPEATGVTVSGDGVANGALSLKKGTTAQLTAKVAPDDADQAVTWASSDDKVVTVDKTGKVTAVAKGVAKVTATTANGKSASVTVTVTEDSEVPGPTGPTEPTKPGTEKPTTKPTTKPNDGKLSATGADTADVQRLFQGTLSDMIERYDIIRHAELYHNDIAIAAVEQDIDRVTAAKAADELLTLRGVRASFVLFKHDTGVNLSARSLGEINVQLIMEKLGGGGNSTTAGGQIPDGTVDAVREQLIAAIDQYLEG